MLRSSIGLHTRGVHVVDVHATNLVRHLVQQRLAVVAQRRRVGSEVHQVRALGLDLGVQVLRVQAVAVQELDRDAHTLLGAGADLGADAAIAHGDALQVDLGLAARVALEDARGQRGHVDPGVALPGDEELARRVLGEHGGEESVHKVEVLLGRRVVVAAAVHAALTVREAHAHRALQEDDVGDAVPPLRVVVQAVAGAVVHEVERALLLEEAAQAGASRPAVQPQHHGVVLGVVLGLHKPVVQVATGIDLDVSRVLFERRLGRQLRQRLRDQISGHISAHERE
mmetsp:Transcript_7442/g.23454  ORF Transcript_7442/g.23454 Transcript_7442/m.23454 type:complete len:284 (+) Transcript_7442:751-1602(+)